MYGGVPPQPAGSGDYPPPGTNPGWPAPPSAWPGATPAGIRAPRTPEQAALDPALRATGLIGAALVVLTAALPWLSGPGLAHGSGLRMAGQLWVVGSLFSDVLRLAAGIWLLIPIAGAVLWALRWVKRPWAWSATLILGVATLALVISVLVLVANASLVGIGAGLWLAVAGAAVGVAADVLHLARSLRGRTA